MWTSSGPRNFSKVLPIPTMFIIEQARLLYQVQPSPLLFLEFPFIVNINSMKHRPQLSFSLDFQFCCRSGCLSTEGKGLCWMDVYLPRLLDPYNCNDSAAGCQYMYYLGQERSQIIGESVILFVHFLLFLSSLTINSPPFTVLVDLQSLTLCSWEWVGAHVMGAKNGDIECPPSGFSTTDSKLTFLGQSSSPKRTAWICKLNSSSYSSRMLRGVCCKRQGSVWCKNNKVKCCECC